MSGHAAPHADAAIGVFDSGIGGLSVLQALRAALPAEDIVYLADSAHTPYGERSADFIAERTHTVAHHLREAHGVKLLVVACNTASAAGVQALRRANAGWPVVAVEPALKPAAQRTRTGHVGVLATRATLDSPKYAALKRAVAEEFPGAASTGIACDGLAAAIERAALSGDDAPASALVERYLAALGSVGTAPGEVDTVVLGCTHYPLVRGLIEGRAGVGVTLLDSGAPVARQTVRLLHATGLLRQPDADAVATPGRLTLLATGEAATLLAAARRWLGVDEAVRAADC